VTDTSLRLNSLDIAPSYRNGQDDIASAFYIPCFTKSFSYDRAVGYFSSAIYTIAWPGLSQFITNGGKLRLVCSPHLSEEDYKALKNGHDIKENLTVVNALKSELSTMFESSEMAQPSEVLATLVALDLLEFRIALISREDSASAIRIFHDKVGIFTDTEGDMVVFKGSMNETWSGLSADGNLESIDVFISWGESRERERVQNERAFFNALWADMWPGTRVIDLPQAVREDIIKRSRPGDLESIIEELSRKSQTGSRVSEHGSQAYKPFSHQVQALESWEARERRGILHHATGSGKTVTALLAVQEALRRNESVLIIVPSILLLKQWKIEVFKVIKFPKPNVLVCGGGHSEWRTPGLLAEWTRKGTRPRIVLTTDATASDPVFLGRVRGGPHLMLVADEVHRLGSLGNRTILQGKWGPRLGLSATPDRAGDLEGTKAIRDSFGDDLEPPFGIKEAIEKGRLCRYFYYPHIVRLNEEEEEDWKNLTKRIAGSIGSDESSSQWSEQTKLLLIKRAKILKKAAGKIPLADNVLSDYYSKGNRWLVYCDDSDQLNSIVSSLREKMDARVLPYHTAMAGDAATTLRVFSDSGGIVVAIKCLDEGVDIPAADNALILASSQNPREFIQRRGRVLRTSKNKSYANIHDAIVVPNNVDSTGKASAMLVSEMSRAIEFGQFAENPTIIETLKGQLLALGIDVEMTAVEGVEEDDEQND
jgi:superfamily II DNA or RNA helicase